MSNHSPEHDAEMTRLINEQIKKLIDETKSGRITAAEKLGPTGRFPRGRITPADEGELRIAVGSRDGIVIIDLGKPTAWVGFPPADARALAESLVRHADALERSGTKET
ncbi:MAG TPA: hypothetical protein VJU58_13865 [Microbacterium sp.]|nr:hypothetical protein [Microbacterium sp.]